MNQSHDPWRHLADRARSAYHDAPPPAADLIGRTLATRRHAITRPPTDEIEWILRRTALAAGIACLIGIAVFMVGGQQPAALPIEIWKGLP